MAKHPAFRHPECRSKCLFLVIYSLQLDRVNFLLPTVVLFVGPDGHRPLLLLLWDQMAFEHLRDVVTVPLHHSNNRVGLV